MAAVRYLLTNLLLVAWVVALGFGGWILWAVLAVTVLAGGVADEAVGNEGGTPCGAAAFCDAMLYATLPLLAVITWMLLQRVEGPSGAVAATLGTGYLYALAGATVGHELAHRSSLRARHCARLLFAFTLNPSFESYHVLRHHRNVGLYGDPATARRGEYVLAFVLRSILRQAMEGWQAEAALLRRQGRSAWSWRNRVLSGLAAALAILVVAALVGGWRGATAFLAAALVGRVLHEMVNYVQHYGLVRAPGGRVEARHAWDCWRLLSNALHYNLPRHADHHLFAAKPFWALAVREDAPRLPRGYATMAAIALLPPWWNRLMDPLLADWDRRLASEAERLLVQQRGWSAVPAPPMRLHAA